MSDAISLAFPELSAFVAELEGLPDRMRARLLKGTVATGASVIRKEATSRAPVYTGPAEDGHPPPGTLKKAIYQTRLSEKSSRTLEVWKVDVRRGAKVRKGVRDYSSAAFYASWVEFGHYARVSKSVGKTRKARREHAKATASWVPPKPYMRPAFQVAQAQALQAMRSYFADNLAVALAGARFIRTLK